MHYNSPSLIVVSRLENKTFFLLSGLTYLIPKETGAGPDDSVDPPELEHVGRHHAGQVGHDAPAH